MACRRRRRDDELVRVGLTEAREWYLGRGPGRGAWVCPNADCLGRLRRGVLERAMRCSLSDGDVEDVSRRVGVQIPGSVKE